MAIVHWHQLKQHIDQLSSENKLHQRLFVQGQLMHQRHISRKCTFYDLEIAEDHSNNKKRRLEVILKIIDDELSIEQVQTIRNHVNLGDVVTIHGFVEVLKEEEEHMMLHAVDIQVDTRWKDRFPDVQFVPVPSKPKSRKRSQADMTPTSSSPSHQVICKYWINSGKCQRGAECEFAHVQGQALKEERANWLTKRLHLKRLSAQHTEDPLDPHGKQSKNVRAQVFCDWLVETFGLELLKQAHGVLDVAGGRGSVSFELWNKRQVPCKVIDPRPIKLSRHQFKYLDQFPTESPQRILVDQVRQAPEVWCQSSPSEETLSYLLVLLSMAQTHELFEVDRFTQSAKHQEMVTKSSILIGMHPDEATDAIVDVALHFAKPFAIVPCCVFHQKFPERKVPSTGDRVVSFEQLVEYLQAKHPAMQRAFLPFDGRNLVLFMRPQDYQVVPVAQEEPNNDKSILGV